MRTRFSPATVILAIAVSFLLVMSAIQLVRGHGAQAWDWLKLVAAVAAGYVAGLHEHERRMAPPERT